MKMFTEVMCKYYCHSVSAEQPINASVYVCFLVCMSPCHLYNSISVYKKMAIVSQFIRNDHMADPLVVFRLRLAQRKRYVIGSVCLFVCLVFGFLGGVFCVSVCDFTLLPCFNHCIDQHETWQVGKYRLGLQNGMIWSRSSQGQGHSEVNFF